MLLTFVRLVLWVISFSAVQAWEWVSMSRCLGKRNVNLFAMSLDNCARFDDYEVHSGHYPGVDISLSAEDLECLSGYDIFQSCASCYLCHYYLDKGDYVLAYKKALRALDAWPYSPPALQCLAALYTKTGRYTRAGFYSVMANTYNSSMRIKFNIGNERQTVMQYLSHRKSDVLFPNFTGVHEQLYRNEPRFLKSIIHSLDGFKTIHGVYSSHMSDLPLRLRGPSVLSYEMFLTFFEKFVQYEKNPRDFADIYQIVYGELPQVFWPPSKYISILILPEYLLQSMTFNENVEGLCDVLGRLGIPYKVVSQLVPSADYVSVQYFGVRTNEENSKNFIFWNFEKNPRLNKSGETPGFKVDDCGTLGLLLVFSCCHNENYRK